MQSHLKILVVGGYGIFGGRLIELLENEERLTLVVAGRSLETAQKFCQAHVHAKACLVPALFDREKPTLHLADLKPHLVVDASGPFQEYGARKYQLVEACINAGIHYLDLADGSEFVKGVSAFDQAAKYKGVFVLSGVSSFPVLTALVVRKLALGTSSVETITGGIAPSPFAGVGDNVIKAIASYAGQPVPVKKNGAVAVG